MLDFGALESDAGHVEAVWKSPRQRKREAEEGE